MVRMSQVEGCPRPPKGVTGRRLTQKRMIYPNQVFGLV